MSATSDVAILEQRTEAYCFAQVKNVSVVIWNKSPTETSLEKVQVLLTKAVTDFSDSMAMLLNTRARETPTEAANKKAAAAMRAMGNKIKAVATVTGNTDFWSKVVRVTLHAILGVVRATGVGPNDAAFFSNPIEAAAWLGNVLAKQGIKGATVAELTAAVSQLEKEFPAVP